MKSEERKPETEGGGEKEAQVADYLAAHPEFFERHLELLLALRLPHRTGGGADPGEGGAIVAHGANSASTARVPVTRWSSRRATA